MDKLKESDDGNTNYVCFIVGFDGFKSKLDKDRQNKLEELFNKAKELEIFNFVVVDTIANIKKEEFSTWYKNLMVNNEAIYIGNGLSQQFTIKLTKTPRFLNDVLPENFGYYIKQGIPYTVKLVENSK